ncbi:D-serine ammonia-lyase [Zestomonas carbonaria]|uniref:Probable D-serine dehydratase n=1 Tax=Zestomonas carbonaria TaxID=2762745 RepID=A0A7U7I9L7_9GAMM|nr:D-serine ammonia-lyase [Pseudomonas carbonaria]CAD5108415.1 D-serine dehydratase [Pseudomonas carbonaria]
MSKTPSRPALPTRLLGQLQSRQPFLWLNPGLGDALPETGIGLAEVDAAQARLARCAGLLGSLFPELAVSRGAIESALLRTANLQRAMSSVAACDGVWFVKADHALPVAGSIKARGGFHEVLALAESIALREGLIGADDDRLPLASAEARALFARYKVAVGSTGNLGMSIGLMAAALGFRAEVHMSSDAREWKKTRLRRHGVTVVEHDGDYAAAVAAGREQALADPHGYFVDDEHSPLLFAGYAVAARGLAAQLAAAGRIVDADHPLFVYLPCGVGGAPGGITFGLKALFGDHVHCFFAEPVASPCMLVQLAAGCEQPVSVYDVGLDNRTEADGLAVGQASPLVSPLMAAQLSGVFTVSDQQLYISLFRLAQSEGIALEPSAAAGVPGPNWLTASAAGHDYLGRHGLERVLHNATHVIWTTGGSLVPRQELQRFQAEGLRLCAKRPQSEYFP